MSAAHLLVGADRIDREPDDLRISAVELRLDLRHVAELGRADRGEVLRMREQLTVGDLLRAGREGSRRRYEPESHRQRGGCTVEDRTGSEGALMSLWRVRITMSDDPHSQALLTAALAGQRVCSLLKDPGDTEMTGDVIIELPQDEGLGALLSELHMISPQVFVSSAVQPPSPAIARLRRISQRRSQQRRLLAELPVLHVQIYEHRNLGAQHPWVERLGDVVDGASRVTAERIVGLAVQRGEEDDRHVPRPGTSLDVGGSLESVHSRHQDVEQDDGELIAEQRLERGVPRARRDQFLVERAEDRLERDEVLWAIVH